MQKFLKDFMKKILSLRTYGAILLEFNISFGLAANNGTGDILNFLASDKKSNYPSCVTSIERL